MSAFVVDKTHIDAMVTAGLAFTRLGPLRWMSYVFPGSKPLSVLRAERDAG